MPDAPPPTSKRVPASGDKRARSTSNKRGVVANTDILLGSDGETTTIQAWISEAGYNVAWISELNGTPEAVQRVGPRLIVMDFGPSAFNLVHELRRWTTTPILILDRDEEPYLVAALDAGADDYVAKPPRKGEMLARIRALLRRGATIRTEHSPPIVTPDFTIDLVARRITRQGENVSLTPVEWSLVETLARHPDALVSQKDLLTGTWGPDKANHTAYLRVHMRAIRAKLEPDPHQPRYFRTESGVGIRFCPGIPPPVRATEPRKRTSGQQTAQPTE